jgi:hypothetical protein
MRVLAWCTADVAHNEHAASILSQHSHACSCGRTTQRACSCKVRAITACTGRETLFLQALLSFYQTLFARKLAPRWLRRTRTDVLTFALAMAAVMHCYSDAWGEHRDIFRSKYLNVLDFMFGGEGLDIGSVSHTTTNRELLWRASAATQCAPTATLVDSCLVVREPA